MKVAYSFLWVYEKGYQWNLLSVLPRRIGQFSWGEHPWPELIIWNPYFEHLCRCKNVKIYKSLCQWGLERLIKLITTSHPHPWQANRQNLNPAQYHLAILLTIINITVKRPEWIDKRDFKQCFLLFKAFLELLKGEKREGAVPATPFQQSHTCSSGASFARLAGQQGACKRIEYKNKERFNQHAVLLSPYCCIVLRVT